MSYSSPPGVFDIVPRADEIWRSSHLWNYVEGVIRELASCYGFEEIRTPLFEKTELFCRGVGDATDIVAKEMYTFEDRAGRSLSLRPEGTAAAMRAFLEHNMNQKRAVTKLYYIAPMFRYERAQAGRYRQHHQFGVEAIGSAAPEQDVEAIDMILAIYRKLGVADVTLYINSIGDGESRQAYKQAFKSYLQVHFDELSVDSRRRFDTNPLRILDSKEPQDQRICEGAPSLLDFLNEECRDHFDAVQKLLKSLKIDFLVDHKLVRGLDYYNKTVFEITAGKLGAQNSVCGGGRYDGLIRTLGGPDLPAFGFGTGLERIIQAMINQKSDLPESYSPLLYFVALGVEAKGACFKWLHELRRDDITAAMDFSGKKLGKAMALADQLKARFVAIVGDDELQSGILSLKDMSTGEQEKVPREKLLERLKNSIEIKNGIH